MSYCLNPQCSHPQNPDDAKFCLTCGAKLFLRERYQAIKPIGHGGFGKTFLAVDHDKPSHPPCVIKQFFPQTQGVETTRKAAELFHQEAQRLDELGKHPHIPDLLAHFQQDNNQYLVQEYINGPNLEDLVISQGTFNETQIIQLLDELLPVLEFIHQNKVIHRDIKPANIIQSQTLVNSSTSGKLVLVDFGAAKVVQSTNLSGPGTIIGSPEYVAPEQTRGQAIYASDIYSLGVTCLYLLTQISPFDLYDIHQDKWVWRDYLQENTVSNKLGLVLDRMVASLPSQRYNSPLNVLRALHPSGLPPTILHNININNFDNTALPSPAASVRVPRPPLPPPPPRTARTSQQITPPPTARTSQPPTPPKPSRVQPQRSSPSWKLLHTLTGHRNQVTCVAFSPDQEILASSSQDLTIEIWRLKNGKRWYTLTGHENWVTSIAFSPKEEILASGSRDQTVEIWDLKKGKRWYTLIGHQDAVEQVAFSPQGDILASASRDKTIQIWDLKKGKPSYTLYGHSDRIYGVAFSPDGQTLASASRDKTVRLWNLQQRKELGSLPRWSDWVRTVAFSPNGQMLAGGCRDGSIGLWHQQDQTWKLWRTLRADDADIFAIAFKPDSTELITGNSKGQIDIWQLGDGTLLETIAAHSADVLSLAFSLDGKTIASGGSDRLVKIWYHAAQT